MPGLKREDSYESRWGCLYAFIRREQERLVIAVFKMSNYCHVGAIVFENLRRNYRVFELQLVGNVLKCVLPVYYGTVNTHTYY